MRVVAFWGALAGFVAVAGHATLLVARLTASEPGPLLEAARLAADAGQIVFTLLAGVFLLIVAVTDRKV